VQACRAMREPMVLESGQPVTVTASLGVALALPGADLARVQRSADVALYRAKCYGGDQPVQYDVSGKLAVVEPGRPALRLREIAGIQRNLSEAAR
jgi:GGDEF domain-containing protein